ncbi:DNA polymerase III subunit gamma/tau [Longibacter sp.]|uniref:DNA polymerase III subunit gamma/tau n=1 Tax=Longibacter sp. TaxID=2045415 RepID=UPI003EB9ED71
MADSQRYLVTARKYRPKLFREVVAQEHVTDTLKNALRLDRLAHAYLFSGPRGVGKTTSARILAKAINCETPRSEREDEAEPCCECDSCLSFEDGRSMNVFEMDAASNNKVDDIRELRETVRIPPQGSTKKVYILDEVHMLSTAAFNALLKTLEEPPPHALFIFATTEPHKVLPTILSRCQRFDFRRIPVPNMVEHLRTICEEEDIDADEESLMLLARKGDGALRDALSAFDQAISLCGTTIEYGELTQALGVVDQDLFFQLTDHVVERSTAGVLKLVHHVVRNGYDLNEFLSGVAEHIRNLLVAHSLGTDALEDVAESTRDRYAEDSRAFSESDLLRLLMITGEAEEDVKNTSQPRLKLEMALLKMASLTRSADLRTVLGKIDRLERMVEEGEIPDDLPLGNGGDTAPPAADAGDGDAEDDIPAATSTTDGISSGPSGRAPGSDAATGSGGAETRTAAPPATDAATREKPARDHEAETVDEAADGEKQAAVEADEGTESKDDDADDTTGGVATAGDPADDAGDGSGGSGIQPQDLFGTPAIQGKKKSSDDDGRPENQASALTGDAAPAGDTGVPEARPSGHSDAREDGIMRELKEVWPDLIKKVKADRISVGTQLGPTKPVGFDNGIAEIGVPDNLTRERLRDKQRYLLNALLDSWELDVESLRFVVREPEENEEQDGAAEEKMPLDPHEMLTQLRERYPSVDTLVNEFGAEPAY